MKQSLRCLKNEKGFSLIELMVAFTMLAIVGSVLLNVFVQAGKINRRGYDTDRFTMIGTKLIEGVKAAPSVTPIGGTTYFYDTDLATTTGIFPGTTAYKAVLDVTQTQGIVQSALIFDTNYAATHLLGASPASLVVHMTEVAGLPVIRIENIANVVLATAVSNPALPIQNVVTLKITFTTVPDVSNWGTNELFIKNDTGKTLKIYPISDTSYKIKEPVIQSGEVVFADTLNASIPPVYNNTYTARVTVSKVDSVTGAAATTAIPDTVYTGTVYAE